MIWIDCPYFGNQDHVAAAQVLLFDITRVLPRRIEAQFRRHWSFVLGLCRWTGSTVAKGHAEESSVETATRDQGAMWSSMNDELFDGIREEDLEFAVPEYLDLDFGWK